MTSAAASAPLLQSLRALAEDPRRDRISVSDAVAATGDRALVLLVLVFALPNAVPVPPGTSAILGAPLLCLTVEWVAGLPPWVPRWLGQRSVARQAFASTVAMVENVLAKTERLFKPRLQVVARPFARRLAAGLCAALAVLIVLPIPFGNMPPAWAISLIALGLLRGDGAWVLVGAAVGTGSIALVWGVVASLAAPAWDWICRLVA